MPDKLIKHGRFARSGIYKYSHDEVKQLGLPWPPPNDIGEKSFYDVLRPAAVLSKAVKDGMFNRLPMTRGHPDEWVDPNNFREHTVGFTGDQASIEYLPDIDEVAVAGSMTLADAEAIDAYERGVKELSTGYSADFVWKRGQLNGKSYDAVMTAVSDGNHMALVNKGRGGAVAAILDQEGSVRLRKIVSGMWWKAKRRIMVKDYSGPGSTSASMATGFSDALSSLISSRAAKKDEEISEGIDELKKLLKDLPDGDEKGLLMKYMDDLKLMKEEKDDVVREAQNLACALFDKIDKHALSEEDIKMKDCAKCDGTGKVGGKDCAACGGKGKIADEGLLATGAKAVTSAIEKSTNDEPAGTVVPSGSPSMEKPAVKDEPDPTQPPATVPPAPAPAAAPQAPSPSPGGVPQAPAAAQGGVQALMAKLAAVLQEIMNDPEIKAMMARPAAPAAAPAPAAAAAPAPAAAPPKPAAPPAAPAPAPEKKDEPPSGGGAKDSASSLTALLASSEPAPETGMTLDGIVDTIHGRKGK